MLWILRENDHCTYDISCKLSIPLLRTSGGSIVFCWYVPSPLLLGVSGEYGQIA